VKRASKSIPVHQVIDQFPCSIHVSRERVDDRIIHKEYRKMTEGQHPFDIAHTEVAALGSGSDAPF